MNTNQNIIKYMGKNKKISIEDLVYKFSMDYQSAYNFLLDLVNKEYFVCEKDGVFELKKEKVIEINNLIGKGNKLDIQFDLELNMNDSFGDINNFLNGINSKK